MADAETAMSAVGGRAGRRRRRRINEARTSAKRECAEGVCVGARKAAYGGGGYAGERGAGVRKGEFVVNFR